jgi:hypothetical protein
MSVNPQIQFAKAHFQFSTKVGKWESDRPKKSTNYFNYLPPFQIILTIYNYFPRFQLIKNI